MPGRNERRVVSELVGRNAGEQNSVLTQAGYRRSHSIVYAPACPDCDACRALRIKAPDFDWTRSWRRVMNVNRDLAVTEIGPTATAEQFDLFTSYQLSRHVDGDMAKMNYFDYNSLIEDTPVDSYLTEFRDAGKLVAVCITDRLRDGLSAVYSFFEPGSGKRSLGTFMILQLVEQAQARKLEHVYLGFWISDCAKMSYKSRFRPFETFTPEGWRLREA
jgi:arginine-tRNA-protein transferase